MGVCNVLLGALCEQPRRGLTSDWSGPGLKLDLRLDLNLRLDRWLDLYLRLRSGLLVD